MRVSGELVGGTVEGLGTTTLKFVLHDRDQHATRPCSVVYNGAIPDSFKDQADAEVVAEGDFAGRRLVRCDGSDPEMPEQVRSRQVNILGYLCLILITIVCFAGLGAGARSSFDR